MEDTQYYICSETKATWALGKKKKTGNSQDTGIHCSFPWLSNVPHKGHSYTTSNINNSSKAIKETETVEKYCVFFFLKDKTPDGEIWSHICVISWQFAQRVKAFSYIKNTSSIKIHTEG